MTPPVVALTIIAIVIVSVIVLASFSVRGVLMNPEQYIVGGRSFGSLLLWLLMAGEIYTSFTFLGAAGWAYGKGAPAFYILCYGPIAYIISYFLLPPMWRVAKQYGLLTGPDFFRQRYRSTALGVLVALVGFLFLVPYVTLQLTGLQILLHLAGYGAFDATAAVAIAFMLTALFVFSSGLRGLAWASVAKDALVLLAVGFVGIVLPVHFFGSPANAISRVIQAHPHWMTLDVGATGFGTKWFVSTVLLTACGFWVWPHSMAATYSAKSDDALRRNAIFLPFYNVMLLLVFFAGFTALVVLPGLRGPAVDQSFMLVVQRYYPPWVLGLLASAGCLAALIPASSQLLAAASVVGKNVLGDWLQVATSDAARTRATRILVIIVALLALAFWAYEKTTLVNLLLIAYSGMTQLLPGVVLAFAWRRTSAWGVGAGIVAGLVVLAVVTTRGLTTLGGLNIGFLALVANAAVCVGVSLYSRAPEAAYVDEFAAAAARSSHASG
ncbi:MAG TPA: sodium:solute symporter family protein [Candidatus Eremiobacteraceae bacterium]|nr:sodium:solute symporter family protein [Candidatus Eremiobacteraceae bacterium]